MGQASWTTTSFHQARPLPWSVVLWSCGLWSRGLLNDRTVILASRSVHLNLLSSIHYVRLGTKNETHEIKKYHLFSHGGGIVCRLRLGEG
jgi:hypothetical protein